MKRNGKSLGELPIMSIENPTLAHFRHFRHSFNYNIFPIHSIMRNKPNVKHAKINVTSVKTMRYTKMDNWLFRQTKPIQTQLKPKQTQFNPKQTQFKPISKPIKANWSEAQVLSLSKETKPILPDLEGNRTEIRCQMSETMCLWQLKLIAHSGIIIELKMTDVLIS